MAYSVHGSDGWQKSKIFKGEEAIKNKQGEWAHVRGEGKSGRRG